MPHTVFTTSRLHARELIPADVADLLAVYGDAEAMQYVGDGEPITEAQCEEWVQVTQRNYAQRGYGMFALVEAETGTIIGFAGLVHPGGQIEPEVKYAFLKSHWGRGFATEAVRGILAYARSAELPVVIATVHPENRASQHVLEKSGMRLRERRATADQTQTLVFETLECSTDAQYCG